MFKYSIKSLKTRKIITSLYVLALIIAVSISMLSINITSQIKDGFYKADKKYDVIIGPNGSDVELIMSSMFFSSNPIGTIDYCIIKDIEKMGLQKVIPLSIADNYKDARIIGSTKDLLDGYKLKEGSVFENHFEIVLGSEVAKAYGVKLGDKIVSSHGVGHDSHDHDQHAYKVVGILNETKTAYDNVCFTSLESIWEMHGHNEDDKEHSHENGEEHSEEHDHDHEEEHVDEHNHDDHKEICAILIKSGNLQKIGALELEYKDNKSLQIVNTTKVLRKLMTNIDLSKQVAYLLCGIILVLSTILIIVMSFLTLNSLNEDIKVLKFLNLKKSKIVKFIVNQSIVLSLISVLIGIGMSRILLLIANKVSSSLGIILDVMKFYNVEIYITIIILILTIIPSFIYAILKTKGNKE